MQPTTSSLPPPPVIAADSAVFLDVDGTLLDLAPTPDAVRLRPETVPLLRTVRDALDGALALVSGRPAAQVQALFAPLAVAVAGLHGLERQTSDGPVQAAPEPPGLSRARKVLTRFVDAHPGTLLEDKGATVALHYRRAPDAETAARETVRRLAEACGPGVRVQEGKMVLELRAGSAHKGDAVRAFLAEPPFRARRPVYVGDDVTDEDAFRTVTAEGGWAVRVGPSAETAAGYLLADVDAVHDWLARSADALEGQA